MSTLFKVLGTNIWLVEAIFVFPSRDRYIHGHLDQGESTRKPLFYSFQRRKNANEQLNHDHFP